jgi:YidC/Oxa1 family membrane protein insertase
MEKRVVVAIGLTVVLYVVYLTYFTPPVRPRPEGGVSQGTVATGTAPRSAEPRTGGGGAARAPSPQNQPSEDVKLSNERVDLVFSSRGAGLKAAEAWGCRYHERGDRSVPGDPGVTTAWVEDAPGALSADLLAGAEETPDLARSHWSLERGGERELVARMAAAGVTIERTVRLSADPAHPWHADVEYVVRNESARPGAEWTLEVVGPVMPRSALPNDGLLVAPLGEDGDSVDPMHPKSIHEELAEKPRMEHVSPSGRWAYLAARSDFYLGALVPGDGLPRGTTVGFRKGSIPVDGALPAPTAAATFRIPLVVPPVGSEAKFSFLWFSGPTERSLAAADASPYRPLREAIEQPGWLGAIRGLLSWLLAALASTGMGYGLAVISLTILVRTALFPLSRKSQISMRLHAQRMARLKPKMDAIKAKHKDPKKQQEMTMKLMREEKVSLLPGGCLLAFAQMPIWIALYGVLQTTFEMRHAQFLWAKDLTAPDHLVHLAFAKTWWLVPEWINLLPILMMVVWYASAAMQPLPADPQQAQQAKMMRWMPVLFGFFLYSTAAGLTLYMTMSALWSIGETWVIRKLWLTKLENALK